MTKEEFVKSLVLAYESGKGIFSKKLNAEDQVPKDLSKLSKSLFLFYVLQLDYGMKSQMLYDGAKELMKEHPEFLTPQNIKVHPGTGLQQTLKRYLHPRYINEAVLRYKSNTDLLLRNYSGDPRKIFTASKTAREVEKKVRKFRGFGPKIGNFFIRSMVNCFSYNYVDLADITQPVDIHDVRVTYLMGFISSPKMTTTNIKKVKEIWKDACKKVKVSWLDFDKALWLLGSEGKPKSREDVLMILGAFA